MKELITVPNIEAVFKAKGYPIFKGPYNLTVGAVRRTIAPQADVFDDYLFLMYDDPADGQRKIRTYEATTEPGRYWGTNPITAAANLGSAIIKPGFYRGAYTWGIHGTGNWRHRALIQTGPITIFRDATWDGVPDTDKPDTKMKETTGLYGCNLHASVIIRGARAEKVYNWSAGCLVHGTANGYFEWAEIIDKATRYQGPKFSLFLITEGDLIGLYAGKTPELAKTKKGSIGVPAEKGDEPT